MTAEKHCFKVIVAMSLLLGGSSTADQDIARKLFDVPWIGYDTAVYPHGLFPLAGESADFNADGVPDLATVGGETLSILLGDGKGGFLAPELYALLTESLDLAVFDFDSDGDIDIVTSDTGPLWSGFSVSVYLNDGTGSFSWFSWYDIGSTGPSGITTDDFDNDGWIDIATANDAYIVCNNTVSVLFNANGNGFQTGQVYAIAGCTNEIDSGDVNGDGQIDIVVAHESNKWSTLLNNAEGGFINMGTTPGVAAGSIPEDPTIHLSDIDLDGDLDVFFSNRDTGGFLQGAVGLWRNNGDGTFGPAEELSFSWATTGSIDTNSGDVTGDGWPDLMCATGYLQWILFASDGQGGFGPPRRFQAGHAPSSIDITDLDLDGALDVVVVAVGSLEACVYLNPGDGSFVQPEALDFADPNIAPAFTTNIEAGDIDADGDMDIVVGFRSDFSESFGITVRRNNGDGTFGPRETYPEVNYPSWIKLADMDGDGDLDLLWTDYANGRFYIRRNDGAGNYTTRLARHSFGLGDDRRVDAVDVDDDGDLDVITNDFFEMKVSKNMGGDVYGAPYIATNIDAYFTSFELGDFNGDSVLDLLTSSAPQGYPQISFGADNGFFNSPFTVSTGRDVHSYGIGDFDHDGNLDFAAVFNLDEKGVSVRRGRGDGNFFLPTHQTGSFQWDDYTVNGRTSVVDVNGDGFDDLLFANVRAQDFSFWLNNGDGTFQRPVRFGAGHQVHDLFVADFTGDGIVDAAMSTQIDDGRWWHTGVVIIKGIDQGGSSSGPADLIDLQMIKGLILSGTIDDLRASDEAWLITRSGFGASLIDLHHMELQITAVTTVDNPTTVDVSIESRISHSAGQAQIRVLNWNTHRFDTAGTYPIGQTESTDVILEIDASKYISVSGEIVVRIKHFVFVPFIAFTFDSFIDEVKLTVE